MSITFYKWRFKPCRRKKKATIQETGQKKKKNHSSVLPGNKALVPPLHFTSGLFCGWFSFPFFYIQTFFRALGPAAIQLQLLL